MKKYLLFDLDGTLTDPKVGITSCVQYALQSFGIEEPDLDKLEPFIGPPLKDSFMNFYQLSESEAEKAVEKYRERFQDIGVFENKIYEGVPEMLRTLQSKGMHLAIASSKPTVFVERILEHFKIAQYFEVVMGSELDGTRVNKDEVVGEALKRLFGDKEIQSDKVYMIGDRKFDVEGAKAYKIESIGVTYGYGGLDELKEAKADYIVRSVEELKKFLLRGTEEVPKNKITFQVIWQMLYPFLIFMITRRIVSQLLALFMTQIGGSLTGVLADFLIVRNETGEFIGLTGNTATIIWSLGFAAGAFAIRNTAKMLIQRGADDMKLSHLKPEPVKNYMLLFIVSLGAVLGMNLLLELTNVTNKSEAYQAVVEDQFSAAVWVGIICYGVITPIAEELLFRGVLYNYLKRIWDVRIAALLSAFLFGSYHMNPVQGVYGFVIGCLMVYGYEYFGSFYIPVAIHILSNVLAFSLSNTSIVNTAFVSWPVCAVCFLIAGSGIYLLNKQKRSLKLR